MDSGGGLVTKSCLTLGDPMDCSLPCFSVHGIFQARILEWVAISFSRGSSTPRDRNWVSYIVDRFFPTELPGKHNMDCGPGKSEWLAKGNWKKCPIKLIQTTTRAQLRDSPSESARVSLYMYCSHFPPNKYFTCFTAFRLYGNSFLQSWSTKDLGTDCWSSS